MLLKEGTKQETIHLNALEKDHVEGYDLNVPTLQMNANSSAEVMNNQNSMFHGSIDNNSSITTSQLMPSTLNPNGSVDTSTNMLDGISDLDSIRSNKVDFFDMNHPMWWNEYVVWVYVRVSCFVDRVLLLLVLDYIKWNECLRSSNSSHIFCFIPETGNESYRVMMISVCSS